MAETSFSGYAMVNHGGTSISLVFSEGTCILAEYQTLQGARAWDAVRTLEGPAEVALYLLTGPQIRLAAEFNAKAAVPRPEKRQEEGPVKNQRPDPRPAQGQATPLQVPRGRLIEIRQGVVGNTLLEELERDGFTGYAIFNLDSSSHTLVFSGGACVLAGGGRERGAPVLRTMRETDGPCVVAVYSLTGPQLALAMEFNQECKVGGGRTRPASPPPVLRRRREADAAPVPVRPGAQGTVPGLGPEKRSKKVHHPGEPAPESYVDPVLKDLAALDTIDADQMAVDLKESYLSILDRLELGHLVEKEKKKE
ncbi:hypothetical protein J2129_001527 [Methanofollis sp. W23]|uniref:hypothetical protein n=1 Tax=Methanofollis sp. W23 TaxID=2817849 RepID=UPI001AE2B528|nr:hypothetical protein [Methanofollis sp. W23]MBP2146073.1 hypothetical protein [Methanofollis sp. W23]